MKRIAGTCGPGWQYRSARRIGVTPAAVCRWVHGQGGVSTELLVRISRLSGVSLDWLLTGEGPVGRHGASVVVPGETPGAVDMREAA